MIRKVLTFAISTVIILTFTACVRPPAPVTTPDGAAVAPTPSLKVELGRLVFRGAVAAALRARGVPDPMVARITAALKATGDVILEHQDPAIVLDALRWEEKRTEIIGKLLGAFTIDGVQVLDPAIAAPLLGELVDALAADVRAKLARR